MKSYYLLSICFILLAGCVSRPKPADYVDPGAQGQIAGTGIESQDIGAAAQKAAQSILSLPQIAYAKRPPTILITPVSNRSAYPIDGDLYTTKLRGTLMQYANGKVIFLARDISFKTNNREQEMRSSGAVQSGRAHRQGATYDYILTADLMGISASGDAGQSDYFLVSFRLVDFKDILIWENQYEIKKEARESMMYR